MCSFMSVFVPGILVTSLAVTIFRYTRYKVIKTVLQFQYFNLNLDVEIALVFN